VRGVASGKGTGARLKDYKDFLMFVKCLVRKVSCGNTVMYFGIANIVSCLICLSCIVN
jgi:ribosomal protein S27E